MLISYVDIKYVNLYDILFIVICMNPARGIDVFPILQYVKFVPIVLL